MNLLGEEDQRHYVWLVCEGTTVAPDGSETHSGQSIPAVVNDSGQITSPRDGDQYPSDVKAMFPDEVAARILSGEDLRP